MGPTPRNDHLPLPGWLAIALVVGTSAAILVLEILAGRLLAPYVGVSLETYTGIIGTVLALSLIHISEPTRQVLVSRMPSSA